MTTVDEPRAFIRPDGKEKVTGTGRYTADLNLTGQVHAAFRYADHTHARDPPDRHGEGACAARRARGGHARGRARRPLRRHGAGPAALRARHRALRGRHRRRRRRPHTRARAAGCRARRGRVRAAAGRLRLGRGDGGRRHADPPGLGVVRVRRHARAGQEHARLLDDRQGRRRRRHGDGGRRRQGAIHHRSSAGRSDRAAGDPRRVER